jgi:hypothetical protein
LHLSIFLEYCDTLKLMKGRKTQWKVLEMWLSLPIPCMLMTLWYFINEKCLLLKPCSFCFKDMLLIMDNVLALPNQLFLLAPSL